MQIIKTSKILNRYIILLGIFFLSGKTVPTKYQLEFEYFKELIYDFNSQIEIRKAVTGYNVIEEINKLQPQVDSCYNDITFLKIICKALLANIDLHCYIPECDYINSIMADHDTDSVCLSLLCKNGRYAEDLLAPKFNVKLPIKYINGEYVLIRDIKVDGVIYKKGLSIRKCNGVDIHKFINSNIPEFLVACQWDFERNRYFNEYLYRIPKVSNIEGLSIQFENYKTILKIDSTTYIDNVLDLSFISYKCVKKVSDSILYIKIPEMYDAQFYLSGISDYKLLNFKGIIIDVRGNMGGRDEIWQKVLSTLYQNELDYPNTFYFNNSKALKKYFGMKGPLFKVEDIKKKYIDFTYIPDQKRISNKPELWIIQDRDVFSGTGNLLRAVKILNCATIIGQKSGYLLGQQSQPIVIYLKESKIPFTLAPAIDVYNIDNIVDAYHACVDFEIDTKLDYYYNLYSVATVESKIQNDIFIKYAIDQINK